MAAMVTIVAGALVLVAAVLYAGVPLEPSMVVGMVPLAFVLVALLVKGVNVIKRPAWLTLPLGLGVWGGTSGLVGNGDIGGAFCAAGFGLIGAGLGIVIERRRRTGSPTPGLAKPQEIGEPEAAEGPSRHSAGSG